MFFRKKIKPQFTITIPEPCNEVWDDMREVDDLHRHCNACERTLTDFSVMTDEEIVIFFKQHNGKVCGRFRKDQVDRPFTPLAAHTTKAKWWKAAALLPLSLFSKNAGAQQLHNDSAHIAQNETPLMVLPDTTPQAKCVTLDPQILLPQAWPFEIYVMGVPPPFPHEQFIIQPFTWTLTVDTIVFATPPKTDSSLGAQAQTSSVKKMPGKTAAGFAGNFGAAGRKQED